MSKRIRPSQLIEKLNPTEKVRANLCSEGGDKRLTSEAIALSYFSNSGAPKIVAKGRGMVAENIIAKAEESGVFVHESRELLMLLGGIELDKEIPSSLYHSIAVLLNWVHEAEAVATNS